MKRGFTYGRYRELRVRLFLERLEKEMEGFDVDRLWRGIAACRRAIERKERTVDVIQTKRLISKLDRERAERLDAGRRS